MSIWLLLGLAIGYTTSLLMSDFMHVAGPLILIGIGLWESVTVSHGTIGAIHPIVLCILIGIQGFLMTLIGITLGRMLRFRMKNLKELTEFLSAFLLIGLGIWLLAT